MQTRLMPKTLLPNALLPKALGAGLVVALVMIGAARAETVVVAATGDTALPPGTKLDPGQMISLPEGARLTLLTQSGIMEVIDGPFEGVPDLDAGARSDGTVDAQWSAALALVGFPESRSDVMGASRSTDGAFRVPPSIWHISIDSAGPRCTRPGTVQLWRQEAERDSTVSVRSEVGRLTDVDWPAGEPILALPAEFAAPGRMIVSVDGDLRDLTLAVAPDDLVTQPPGQVLSWLLSHECKRQALTLIERVHAGLGVTE